VSRGAVLRSAMGCVKHNKEYVINGTSLVVADSWCFRGKPTGNGARAVTVLLVDRMTLLFFYIRRWLSAVGSLVWDQLPVWAAESKMARRMCERNLYVITSCVF